MQVIASSLTFLLASSTVAAAETAGLRGATNANRRLQSVGTPAPSTVSPATPPPSANNATPTPSTTGPVSTPPPSAGPLITLEDLTATSLGTEQRHLLELVFLAFGAESCQEEEPPADSDTPDFIRFFLCQDDEYKAVARTTGNVQLGIDIFDLEQNSTIAHQSFCTRAPTVAPGSGGGFSFEECTSRLSSFFAMTFLRAPIGTPAPPSGTPAPSSTPAPTATQPTLPTAATMDPSTSSPSMDAATASPSMDATTTAPNRNMPRSHVFTMTNAQDGNQVLMFQRDMERGTLTFIDAFNTSGIGGSAQVPPSDPLASQDSIVLTTNEECILAVNAGSDTLTSFSVESNKLVLAGVYNTSGSFPVSVQENGNVVYVLNAGGEGSISGFIKSDKGCELTPIEGSTRSLNMTDGQNPPFFLVSPAQIGFTPDGSHLVVLEKGSTEGTIVLYPVDYSTGLLGEPVPTPSEGFTPFAFDFDLRGNLLVAEAFGTAAQIPAVNGPTLNAGAVSSYQVHEATGELTAITSSEGTLQTASCWVRYHESGCAFTTNNGNANSISSLRVDSSTGDVSLVQSVADTLDTPIDLSIVDDFLYVLSTGHGLNGQPSIHVYEITASSCDIDLLEVLQDGIPSEQVTIFGVMGMAAS